jgi:hypothetical protein
MPGRGNKNKKKSASTGKKGASSARRYASGSPPSGRVAEPAVLIRRKNFDLDQRRIDRVRLALGAKTEREAITRAMDIALDTLAFEEEVAAGSRALFGKGGFENVFDDPEALDYTGFTWPSGEPDAG